MPKIIVKQRKARDPNAPVPGSSLSIGDKVPSKGFGTKHIYWKTDTSGYFVSAAQKETKTRVKFADEKFELERSTNPLFAESPSTKPKGQYLVSLPPPHNPSEALLTSTGEENKHTVLTASLKTAVEVDHLKREHARLSQELRELEFMTSTDSFLREKALHSFDITYSTFAPPHFGCGKSMPLFSCIRSKPKYTQVQ